MHAKLRELNFLLILLINVVHYLSQDHGFLCDKYKHIYNQDRALQSSFTVTNVF